MFFNNAPSEGDRMLFQGNYSVTEAGFTMHGKEWLIAQEEGITDAVRDAYEEAVSHGF